MLNIYYTNEQGKLTEINEIRNGCWIKLVSPTEEEINNVVQRLQIPLDFIKDALDEEERPLGSAEIWLNSLRKLNGQLQQNLAPVLNSPRPLS